MMNVVVMNGDDSWHHDSGPRKRVIRNLSPGDAFSRSSAVRGIRTRLLSSHSSADARTFLVIVTDLWVHQGRTSVRQGSRAHELRERKVEVFDK
jgi:hypothetical protein